MPNFNSYSKYYDLLYKDKKYKVEAEYVMNALCSTSAKKVKSILELGCGSGPHAEYFCRKGIKVTGLERSAEMVQEALGKKIENFTPMVGNIENYSLNKQFDAVVSLFHVISYLTFNESLVSCFETTARHLKKGGVFLFDAWYSPAVYTLKPETRIKRMEDKAVSIVRLSEPEVQCNSNVVDVHFDIMVTGKATGKTSVIKETHPMRHFSLPEIKLLAGFTGFKFLHAEEFLTKKPPCDTTWGVCFILQKK